MIKACLYRLEIYAHDICKFSPFIRVEMESRKKEHLNKC